MRRKRWYVSGSISNMNGGLFFKFIFDCWHCRTTLSISFHVLSSVFLSVDIFCGLHASENAPCNFENIDDMFLVCCIRVRLAAILDISICSAHSVHQSAHRASVYGYELELSMLSSTTTTTTFLLLFFFMLLLLLSFDFIRFWRWCSHKNPSNSMSTGSLGCDDSKFSDKIKINWAILLRFIHFTSTPKYHRRNGKRKVYSLCTCGCRTVNPLPPDLFHCVLFLCFFFVILVARLFIHFHSSLWLFPCVFVRHLKCPRNSISHTEYDTRSTQHTAQHSSPN